MNSFWSFVGGFGVGSLIYIVGYTMGLWAARRDIDGQH